MTHPTGGKESEHTAWTLDGMMGYGSQMTVAKMYAVSEGQRRIAFVTDDKRATFIVLAANCHDELVSFAEVALDALRIAAGLIASRFPENVAESACIELARREGVAALSRATQGGG